MKTQSEKQTQRPDEQQTKKKRNWKTVEKEASEILVDKIHQMGIPIKSSKY